MKTKINIIVAVIIGCFGIQPAFSQITYDYDDAGNRVVRKAVQLLSAEIPTDSALASQPVVVEEAIAVEFRNPQIEETFDEIEIKVYPNPTQGAVFLELSKIPEGENPEIEIWSPSGRLIGKSKITGQVTRINLWGKPGGIYIVKTDISGQVFNWKIIKK